MPKITKDDIIGPTGLGFTRMMFNAICADDTAFNTFTTAIIADQADELLERIGSSIYNDASNLIYVKKAEKCLSAAEMVQRRINIIMGKSVGAGETIETLNERKQRQDYLDQADKWISKLVQGVTSDGGEFAAGALVTSHFGDEDA